MCYETSIGVKQTTTSETKSKRVTEIQTTTTLISRMNKIQYLKRRTPALNEKKTKSEINVYFRISEIVVFDIRNNFIWISQIKRFFGIISDIRNNYFGYPK